MNGMSVLNVNIEGMEAHLKSRGRNETFEMMSRGLFSFPIGNRSVYVRLMNAEDFRCQCEGLTDREAAEYIVVIILAIGSSLVARHGYHFFETSGESRYTLSLDAIPYSEAREAMREMRGETDGEAIGNDGRQR